jgi:hypothetical protein
MRGRWTVMLAVASAMLWSTHAFASSSTRERALLQGLLARMTLEEKLGQLNQLDGRSNPPCGRTCDEFNDLPFRDRQPWGCVRNAERKISCDRRVVMRPLLWAP